MKKTVFPFSYVTNLFITSIAIYFIVWFSLFELGLVLTNVKKKKMSFALLFCLPYQFATFISMRKLIAMQIFKYNKANTQVNLSMH